MAWLNGAARVFALSGLLLLGTLGCGGSADSAIDPPVTSSPSATSTPGAGSNGGQGSAAPQVVGPVAPAQAHVIDHIEDQGGWEHCTHCAARPGRKDPPLALWDFQQHQNTPSLDGSSTRFFIGGNSPYANALHWTKFGGKKDYLHFLFEFDIYASPESLHAQNLEFDLFQGHGGKKFMFGTQCNYDKGIWQGWNGHDWIDFAHAPCKKFPAKTWTHVKWLFERTSDNKLRYVSVTAGDATHSVDSIQSPVSSDWDSVLGIQFQQDMNVDAVDYAIWIDRVKLSLW